MWFFVRSKGTRSGPGKAPTVEQARRKWRETEGGAKKVLWGDSNSLKVIGNHYNVIWLQVTPTMGGYRFWVPDTLVRADGVDTRFAMIYCDGEHYSPIFDTDSSGREKGAYRFGELSQVVKDTWPFKDILAGSYGARGGGDEAAADPNSTGRPSKTSSDYLRR